MRTWKTSQLATKTDITRGKISFRIPLTFSLSKNPKIGLSYFGGSLSFFLTDDHHFSNQSLNRALGGIIWPRDFTYNGGNILKLYHQSSSSLLLFHFISLISAITSMTFLVGGFSFQGEHFCINDSSRSWTPFSFIGYLL